MTDARILLDPATNQSRGNLLYMPYTIALVSNVLVLKTQKKLFHFFIGCGFVKYNFAEEAQRAIEVKKK